MKPHQLAKAVRDIIETAEYHCGGDPALWDDVWDELGGHWQKKRDGYEQSIAGELPAGSRPLNECLTVAERNR